MVKRKTDTIPLRIDSDVIVGMNIVMAAMIDEIKMNLALVREFTAGLPKPERYFTAISAGESRTGQYEHGTKAPPTTLKSISDWSAKINCLQEMVEIVQRMKLRLMGDPDFCAGDIFVQLDRKRAKLKTAAANATRRRWARRKG